MGALVLGLQCKACGKVLKTEDDPELCKECMAVVTELNEDLYNLEEEEEVFDGELCRENIMP